MLPIVVYETIERDTVRTDSHIPRTGLDLLDAISNKSSLKSSR